MGDLEFLQARIDVHLRVLVDEIGPRPPGSPANRAATDYATGVLETAGWAVRALPFSTRWWEPAPSWVEVAGARTAVVPNPFSPPCDVSGPVRRIASLEALLALGDLHGAIPCLVGELGGRMVMPAAFPFLDIEEDAQLVTALQRLRPGVVLSASPNAASIPTFEDPDLGLPSVTLGANLGSELADGAVVTVHLGGEVHAGEGEMISATPPDRDGSDTRVVLSAHIDAKVTTPGALDNAGSVAALLARAEAGWSRRLDPVELVLFNGEDHFDACGEQVWLANTDLDRVAGVINLDGAGVRGRATTVATLSCPEVVDVLLDVHLVDLPGWERADPWYESDHSIFAMQGIPAMAITCAGAHELFGTVVHTPADTRDMVDPEILAEITRQLPLLTTHLRAQPREIGAAS